MGYSSKPNNGGIKIDRHEYDTGIPPTSLSFEMPYEARASQFQQSLVCFCMFGIQIRATGFFLMAQLWTGVDGTEETVRRGVDRANSQLLETSCIILYHSASPTYRWDSINQLLSIVTYRYSTMLQSPLASRCHQGHCTAETRMFSAVQE